MKLFPAVILIAVFITSCSVGPKFEFLDSSVTGIDFSNIVTETDSFHCISYEYIYNGAGVGVGDLNNDGLQDIIFAANQVSPRAYLNLGNFKFSDITGNFKGLTNNQWYSSVTMVDINSDGFLDVYLTSTENPDPKKCLNRLWVNTGKNEKEEPVFTEMAEHYGIAEDGQSVNATFFDYDRDGDLDLYVMNNTVGERMNTSYRKKITDGTAMNNDQLYRNNGNGTFTRITKDAGIVYEGFGLGLAIGDVNKDGYPDIYISNDYISNDLFYINQGNGTFKNEIRNYLSYQTKSSMGNDMADVNNDGNPDIFALDMLPELYYKKRQTINGFSYIFYVNDKKYGYEHQYLRNMIHVHNGFMNGEMLPFSERGQMAGIYASEWSWSPLFADYDNDGDKDLIIANGYPRDMTDKDWTYYKARVYGFVASEKHVIERAPAVKVPNIAFENTGNLKFKRKRREWLPQIPTYSYGAAFVDLDNDGDLDYVVNNLNDKAMILKNTTREQNKKNANFIKIILKGKEGNTTATGAKIELWSNGKYQFMENFLTRGYASCVDPVLHFGLGNARLVDSVKVIWPSTGYISILNNIQVNQIITFNESDAKPENNRTDPDFNKLLFVKCDTVIDYTHQQEDFIDFFLNQNIIPHKFSQIGPCLTKGDLNNDGRIDLITGSTNILPTTVLINSGEKFNSVNVEGLSTQKKFTESDIAIVDIDKDGMNDVVAVAGGYENQSENEYKHYLYKNVNGIFKATELPVPPFIASVIRLCDFNHDGMQDVFIGARVKKGKFPYSNYSWLLVNKNGNLTADSSLRFDAGMVTDALWTDFDNDGWEDLMIAREWNSILLLKNLNGQKFVAQNKNGFEKYHGIWYCIAGGDFDNDGDQDYIAGNLGENHRFTVSAKYPLNLYAVDLELDGNIDPIIAAFWEDKNGKMTEYPVNYMDELCAQSQYIRTLFPDYATFSYSTLSTIINKEIARRIEFKLYVNTTSTYFVRNDKGKFKFIRMPDPVQVSPIKKIIIKDLNNDGFLDVIAGGNDYTYDVSTGYYDANKGLVFINKKDGTFDILTPSKTGLLLKGMIESLVYIDGNPAYIIAGVNRDKILVYKFETETNN